MFFSKYARAFPVKSKNASSVARALLNAFKTSVPEGIRTGKGKEFENSTFRSLLLNYRIRHFTSNSANKCAVIERFNRTLKSKMFKYFTSKGTRKYIDVLREIVSGCNNSVHRSTKFRPADVNTTNEKKVFKNLYGFNSRSDMYKKQIAKLKIENNDKVRVSYDTNQFNKGFYPNWTDNVFTVDKVLKLSKKLMYRLKNEDGDIVKPRRYAEEVQEVTKNTFRVEKIINRRVRKGAKEYFVKSLNYPGSKHSWIPASSLINVDGEK